MENFKAKHINLNPNFVYTPEDSTEIEFTTSTFPGGEEHIRINSNVSYKNRVLINALVDNSSQLMKLVMLTDALRGMGVEKIDLFMPYLPYARQDNIFNKGEALSSRVFANLINSMEFNSVQILDPHSNVGPSHLKNVVIMSNYGFVKEAIKKLELENYVLVSPDAGALKKIYGLAEELKCYEIIKADKLRNLKTTEIIKTEINGTSKEIDGRDLVIVDDICDGGRTFIEIAKELKIIGSPKSITLIVSHGIFSKGMEVFNGLIDNVICTESFGNNRDNVETIQFG